MGLSGISIWQLLIVLAIVVMLFGTKRVRNLGSDLGEAIKGFRSSITDDASEKIDETQSNGDVIDSTLEETSKTKEGK